MRREYPDAPIAGVGAIIVDGDAVLLVQRAFEPLKGHWSLPGGALELGETLEEAVVREVLEETGLVIEPVTVVEAFDRISHDDAGRVRYHYVLVDFLCRVTGGSLASASDALDARWVSRPELNSHGIYGLEPFTVAVIERALRMAADTPRV
jgi:8-oxo-dGTP diphosphatase